MDDLKRYILDSAYSLKCSVGSLWDNFHRIPTVSDSEIERLSALISRVDLLSEFLYELADRLPD